MLFGDLPQVKSVGILTAQNPRGQAAGAKFNKEANRELVNFLRSGNYGPIKAKGKFGGEEDSYIVPNISRDEVVALGRRFDQESVIWADKRQDKNENPYFQFEYIDSKSGNTESTRSVHVGSKDVQDREDFYTQVKGRKFIIPFFDDEHARKVPGKKYGTIADVPETPATPWSADELAKKVETFTIPFFDDPENTELEFYTQSEVSYYSERLADDPYVHQLVDKIHHCEEQLQLEDMTGKHYWHHRGILSGCLQKLRCL